MAHRAEGDGIMIDKFRGLTTAQVVRTLSSRMRDALFTGIETGIVDGQNGTLVALIDRGLVEAGMVHPLTDRGREVVAFVWPEAVERVLTEQAAAVVADLSDLDEPVAGAAEQQPSADEIAATLSEAMIQAVKRLASGGRFTTDAGRGQTWGALIKRGLTHPDGRLSALGFRVARVLLGVDTIERLRDLAADEMHTSLELRASRDAAERRHATTVGDVHDSVLPSGLRRALASSMSLRGGAPTFSGSAWKALRTRGMVHGDGRLTALGYRAAATVLGDDHPGGVEHLHAEALDVDAARLAPAPVRVPADVVAVPLDRARRRFWDELLDGPYVDVVRIAQALETDHAEALRDDATRQSDGRPAWARMLDLHPSRRRASDADLQYVIDTTRGPYDVLRRLADAEITLAQLRERLESRLAQSVADIERGGAVRPMFFASEFRRLIDEAFRGPA